MRSLIHRFKTDEALMLAYQRGDTGAFECLYIRHKDQLFAFLYRSCPRAAVVEELAQDTWIAVINSATRYQPQAAFKTWLFSIARKRLVDFWRRQDNQHSPLDKAPEPASPDNSEQDEQSNALMRVIGELPQEQRDTLLLQQQGFSQRDIAEITGAAEETIKSRLRYARETLRNQLGGES